MNMFGTFHENFIRTLLNFDVKFMIMGGQAAIFYGVRRGTGDLDILVEPTKENGMRVLNAFKALSLESGDILIEEFENPLFLGLGFEPDAVDIFTATPGIDFNESYKRAKDIQQNDFSVKIISIEDLIQNKRQLKRKNEKGLLDEYDVSMLTSILKQKS